MSILTEIERISNAKLAIKSAIITKGGQITDEDKIDTYAQAIDSLQLQINQSSQSSNKKTVLSVLLDGIQEEQGLELSADYLRGLTIIPDSIENELFYKILCLNIEKIEIPNTVTRIENNGFKNYRSGYDSCPTITFEENSQLTSIGDFAFYSTGFRNIIIPASVAEMGFAVFGAHIDINNKIESVIFEENSQLKTLPNSTFYNCFNLTNVILPDHLEVIEDDAFSGNLQNLDSLTIPASVISIGSKALGLQGKELYNEETGTYYTGNWTIRFLGTTPPTISQFGFWASEYSLNNLEKIEVPSSAVEAYRTAPNWGPVADKIVGV